MSYLLDKKNKRNNLFKNILLVLVFLILFYFRINIFRALSFVSQIIFYPVLNSGNKIGEKFKNFKIYFASKNSLYQENLYLKSKIDQDNADRANYDSVFSENIKLKEILGRKREEMHMVLAAILAKPFQSLYNTLIIDAGEKQAIKAGDQVFGLGNIPIGRILEVYPNSSKVILLSSSGEVTKVVVVNKFARLTEDGSLIESDLISNVFFDIVGRGGGNFEMKLPRDFKLAKNDQVVLPGITPYVVGIVSDIISDPQDSFQKVLLVAPINIKGLKFVEVQTENAI